MYICLCSAVTDRQIRQAAAEGAASMRELNTRLGVARQCGKCARCALGILREEHRQGGGCGATSGA